MSVLFHSTLYVDTYGVVMSNRVFVINAAIEEMQATGYLCEQTLQSLTRDELQLVLTRARGDK